ncbi:MAG: hypothetical protein AAF560_12680 [Acidobacteriota bacterium]
MSMPHIHIKSAKFPILPGEDEELINEGTYGWALAQYLEAQLKARGYDVPFVCCEDWGWWVQLEGQPYALGLCVYALEDLDTTHELCVTVSHPPGKRWSWRKFRFFDSTERVKRLDADLRDILDSDPEVEILGYPEEFPLG